MASMTEGLSLGAAGWLSNMGNQIFQMGCAVVRESKVDAENAEPWQSNVSRVGMAVTTAFAAYKLIGLGLSLACSFVGVVLILDGFQFFRAFDDNKLSMDEFRADFGTHTQRMCENTFFLRIGVKMALSAVGFANTAMQGKKEDAPHSKEL